MSEDLLAEMRLHYRYATLDTHILHDNVLYLRCRMCGGPPGVGLLVLHDVV